MSKIQRTRCHFLLQPVWFAVCLAVVIVVCVVDLKSVGGFSWRSILTLVTILVPSVGCLVVVGLLRCETFFKYSLRRIRYTCPKCSTQGLPRFRCPSCAEIVDDLQPTVFGVFHARCECGQPLPTADWTGRLELTKVCPNPDCQHDLCYDDLGYRSEYRIAIVGATSSGKTNLMVTSIWQLEEQFAPHNRLRVSLGASEDAEAYRERVRNLKNGVPVMKTVHLFPSALSVSLTPNDGHSALLYVYDAAGESFADEHELAEHPIDKYDGIMLVIDPLAEEGVQQGLVGELDRTELQAANPAPAESLEILGRLIGVLERVFEIPPGGRIQIPLAVVVTKADVGELDQRYRMVADDMNRTFHNMSRAADHAERYSRRVRSFLRDAGLENALKIVESRFRRVSYFAVSSLRPKTDDQDNSGLSHGFGFQPQGVLAPLIWLCYFTDALSDTDLFDRVFMNWHLYVSRCLKGREGSRAQRIAWVLLLILVLMVGALFASVDFLKIMLCGGAHFITLVVLYLALYMALIRRSFSDD